MQIFARKLAAFAVTSALVLPTTTIANAQVSFGSSSSDMGSSTVDAPTTTLLERGFERLGKAYGQSLNQEEETKAAVLLNQALKNELFLPGNHYDVFNFPDSSRYVVNVLTAEDAHDFLTQLSKAILDAQKSPANNVTDFGVSVGQADDLYYVAIVQKEPNYGSEWQIKVGG